MKHCLNIIDLIGEMLAAAMILGLPFYGSWAYYILTGNYLEFGS